MKRVKTISDIYDICDALNELHSANVATNRFAKKTENNMGLMFFAGLIFGVIVEIQIRNLELRMDDQKDVNRVKELQDQVDQQEEKILQLELELEDLKKKE